MQWQFLCTHLGTRHHVRHAAGSPHPNATGPARRMYGTLPVCCSTRRGAPMKRETKKHAGSRRRAARRSSRLLRWTVAIGVLALIVYGVSQMSRVAYGERQLAMIDFSDLSAAQKQAVMV